MAVWLGAARVAAAVNAVLLVGLLWLWLGRYRQYGATHTLANVAFAAFLLVENALWLYFYVLDPDFYGWFLATSGSIQAGITALCALETAALAFIAWITWQ